MSKWQDTHTCCASEFVFIKLLFISVLLVALRSSFNFNDLIFPDNGRFSSHFWLVIVNISCGGGFPFMTSCGMKEALNLGESLYCEHVKAFSRESPHTCMYQGH